MMCTNSKIELMAPVSNRAMIFAAAEGGANAVYFGLNDGLNMRIHNINFDLRELNQIVELCHYKNLKAYLTFNSVIFDEEVILTRKLFEASISAGIDAVIVHDFIAINLAKEFGIPFIISTMANICNSVSAKFYENLGAFRITLAKELNLSQIATIAKNVSIEVEVFVHGALCMAYSGHCYLSYFLEGKSSLRGECVSPCRWPYKLLLTDDKGRTIINEGEGFFLSSKDLCLIKEVPTLIKCGVKAFKIEGRRRNPEYVEVTSRCYREAIDICLNGQIASEETLQRWLRELQKVYNRSFCKGFIYGLPGWNGFVKNSLPDDTRTRVKVGEVKGYIKENGMCIADICDSIRSGDEIIIIGKGYLRQKVTHLQINDCFTDIVYPPARVLIKVKKTVYKRDTIYILKDKI